MRTKIFVDFWNLQLDWNKLVGKAPDGQPIRIPWKLTLPQVLCDSISTKLSEKATFASVHVYASVDPDGDAGLRKFLNVMKSFPGYSVLVKERKARDKGIFCKECRETIEVCPHCDSRLKRTVEKGIDTAIITDMIQMAVDDLYDIAVLASQDADMCAAVDFIQQRTNKKIFNLCFPQKGVQLRNSCWDHIKITELLADLGVESRSIDNRG